MTENINLTPDEEFAAIYNDKENFPTLQHVADELGIAYKTVKNKAGILRRRRMINPDSDVPKLINRSSVNESPMSEDDSKFQESWTPEDCIDELLRVASIDPDRVVTRNYFRVNGDISESTWNRYFGTFEEFKRQTGIKLSRQQHALERAVAKHASVDHYRKLNVERLDWGSSYLRDNSNRFKTAVIASDLHDKEIDPFFLRVLIDTCRRVQPELIVLGGDVFDLPEFGKYTVDPREWDVTGRIRFVHEHILAPLREACPEAQIDLIEGNHEARLLKHLADASPAMRAVLADLHGMTVGQLLGLNDYEVNYVAKADLSAWAKRDEKKELEKNYRIYWDSFLVHHFPHARHMGLPGVNGHHHQHVVWPLFNAIYGPYEWHQLGCGHERRAPYCEGEKWNNGFAIANVDTAKRHTAFDYAAFSEDFVVVGGQFYHREAHEGCSDVTT